MMQPKLASVVFTYDASKFCLYSWTELQPLMISGSGELTASIKSNKVVVPSRLGYTRPKVVAMTNGRMPN
jgi:hypothetical protein